MEQEPKASPVNPRDTAHSRHMVLISEDPTQWRRAVRAFLREGLAQGEPCLCLHSLYSRPSVCCFLEAVGVDAAAAQNGGLLSFLPAQMVFSQGGEFSPAACLGRLVKAWRQRAPNRSGPFRIVADMNWAADTRLNYPRLLLYEDLINSRIIPHMPLNLLCHYDRALFPPLFLERIVARHQGRVPIPGPAGVDSAPPIPVNGGNGHRINLAAL